MVQNPFFIGVKGAQAGLGVAGDEWLVGGNPSAASTQRKWDRPLIKKIAHLQTSLIHLYSLWSTI